MNIDLSAMDRAYIANLCRRRVVELDRMPGREATRHKEFIREMEYGEELAVRLDNGDSAPAQRIMEFKEIDISKLPPGTDIGHLSSSEIAEAMKK